ncbi:HopJ type III effector protein [Marinomonas transparens]|uniref:HopJ type III effector protein n=1 Tax=Marinomonas transparens TaxID=2795388 RepID=A0A934JRP7_9GAMM|nr:HopJ type III effector protein [Marinomonas transparens]MBJ7538814.1 HopJ type III effector protein [Marinomonas transparens]
MSNTQTLVEKIKATPEQVQFKEVIEAIDQMYDFVPASFTNGEQTNGVNENNGSCKVFAFAILHHLSEQETLHLFGNFYRIDVLENPSNTDHQNIRQFIKNGWAGVAFNSFPLVAKT